MEKKRMMKITADYDDLKSKVTALDKELSDHKSMEKDYSYNLEKEIERRKAAESALAESENQYRRLTNIITETIWEVDLKTFQFTYVSPSLEHVSGFSDLEIKNSRPDRFFSPASLKLITDALSEELIAEKSGLAKPRLVEVEHLHKNGSTFWAEISARFVRDNEGLPYAIVGVTRDITERKQNAEDLQESEARYRILADNISDNIWILDLETLRFSYVSPSVLGITGFTSEEATGFQLEDTLLPPSLEFVNKVLDEELTAARQSFDPDRSRTLELEQYHKNGSTVWTEVVLKCIYDQKKQPTAILGVSRDISERKRLQNKLIKSQKMESLGLLASGVAHDLNNVLSGIVTYPELILMSLPGDSKLRKPLKTMMDAGNRAAAIVQDLLTVARGVAITKEPLKLNDLVGDYLNSPEFQNLKQFYPGVVFKPHFADDLFNICASNVHIRKVVMNLVANAAEAIKESGNVIISTVNRYLDRPLKGYDEVSIGEYAVLSISDDGPGISPNDLDRIFEPFYTKKKMGRSGTGLGLSVVWNVIQDHKGYIDVASDENGTTFDLYFPITRNVILKKDIPLSVINYMGNGEMILVIDDIESQREISCRMLDILGYKCEPVSGGEEAVEYLKQNTVDLVLLDMIMEPGINGYETYERIIKIHPGQKTIILSGFSKTDDVKKTQLLGAGKYIKKPVTLEKIGLAIKEELKK